MADNTFYVNSYVTHYNAVMACASAARVPPDDTFLLPFKVHHGNGRE